MATIRLYRAVKEYLASQDAYQTAKAEGRHAIPRILRHDDPIVVGFREARVELNNAMSEAEGIVLPSSSRVSALRIAGERDVTRFLLQSLHEQGFLLSGDNGEEQTAYPTDWKLLHSGLFDTEDYTVYAMKQDSGPEMFVYLVYGNSPEEVISNYNVGLEPCLKPTFDYIRAFYDPTCPLGLDNKAS